MLRTSSNNFVNNPNAKFKKKNKEMSRVQIIELSVPHKSGAVY